MCSIPPRLTVACLAALLMLGLAGLPAGAEDTRAEEPEQEARGDRERSQRDDTERGARHLERGDRLLRAALMRDLELTDGQEEEAEQIFDAHHQRVRQWHQDNRDELSDLTRRMRAADDDPEQRRALRAEARELLRQRPGLDDLAEAFEDVLTDEQWPQFEQNRERLEQAIAERLRERMGNGDGEREPGAPRPRRHEPGAGPAFEGIELTDEQRDEMREVVEAHREQRREWRREHREQLSNLRQQMREAREADDRDRLGELREQLRELRADQPTRDDLHARYREILDDEQWQQLQRNWEEIRRRAEQRREQRRDERRDADD